MKRILFALLASGIATLAVTQASAGVFLCEKNPRCVSPYYQGGGFHRGWDGWDCYPCYRGFRAYQHSCASGCCTEGLCDPCSDCTSKWWAGMPSCGCCCGCGVNCGGMSSLGGETYEAVPAGEDVDAPSTILEGRKRTTHR